MRAVSPDELVGQLRWRYATKRFDPSRKIPAADWEALEQALVLTPSSFGLQPWKFIVVDDPALRRRLRPASLDQAQVVEASRLVVFSYRKDLNVVDVERHIRQMASVRSVPEGSLAGFRRMMTDFVSQAAAGKVDLNVWATYQLYIALGTFLTAAALLGIDTCPMEGIDPKRYDQILGLEAQGYRTAVVATAGYRAADDRQARYPKVRYPRQEVISHR